MNTVKLLFLTVLLYFITAQLYSQETNSKDTLYLTSGKMIVCKIMAVMEDDLQIRTGTGWKEDTRLISRKRIEKVGITSNIKYTPSFGGVYDSTMLLGILPLENGKVFYSGVIQVEGISADELYNRSRRWFIDAYKSGKDVIQLDDKAGGEVIGRGFFEVYWKIVFYGGTTIKIWQTIKIQVKDGKFKYEISNFNVNYFVSASQYTRASTVDSPLETWNIDRPDNCRKVYPDIDSEVKALIASIEKFIKSKPKADW